MVWLFQLIISARRRFRDGVLTPDPEWARLTRHWLPARAQFTLDADIIPADLSACTAPADAPEAF